MEDFLNYVDEYDILDKDEDHEKEVIKLVMSKPEDSLVALNIQLTKEVKLQFWIHQKGCWMVGKTSRVPTMRNI